jgi:exosortase
MIPRWTGGQWARGVAVLALVGLHAPVVADLVNLWRTVEYNGHGAFVPAFAAMVAWIQRDRLRAASGRGTLPALVLVVAGIALLAIGRAWSSIVVQGISIPLTVAGVIGAMFGLSCARRAAFPLGLLPLMVLPPPGVADAVTLHLQLFAAGVAGAIMRVLGIPFFRSGVVIEMPTLTLHVAAVCNGLRFLMAFLALTATVAQVTQPTRSRKVLLTASAIPIAILDNAVRIAAIGVGVHLIGPQAASGLIHDWIGKTIHALTLIPLAVLAFGGARASFVSHVRPWQRAATTPPPPLTVAEGLTLGPARSDGSGTRPA